jgi:hypothetical protein
MTTSLDTRIRRSLGMIVAVTVVACVGAGSALAGGRPAASYYTKQQLQAMAERGAAKAAHDSLTIPVAHPAASYYTKQQLQAMSQSWAARGALTSVSNAEAALASLSPETRNALLARLGQTPVVTSSESSFGWGDFAIGAAGMLGLVLLAGGGLLAVRFGRRSGSAPVQSPV